MTFVYRVMRSEDRGAGISFRFDAEVSSTIGAAVQLAGTGGELPQFHEDRTQNQALSRPHSRVI